MNILNLKCFIFLCCTLLATFSAVAQDDISDVLDVFEEEEAFDVEEVVGEIEHVQEKPWDVTGSLVLNSSYNYLSHESKTGTDYQGLSKLRTQLNFQYDQDITAFWQTRIAAYVFYDSVYKIQHNREFSDKVIDEYRQEAELKEVWVRGKLGKVADLKIGRQVVNWGRSESLRVLDVLNPVDNREMGLADIENLRLPVSMIKTDFYSEDWSYSLIAIPEIRFSKNPVEGNDFYSIDTSGYPVPIEIKEDEPDDISDSSWAASAKGIYSGWDISFHAARLWNDRPYLEPVFTPALVQPFADIWLFKHSRTNFYGVGGNYSVGSWLLKGELAHFTRLGYTESSPLDLALLGGEGFIDNPDNTVTKKRTDTMFAMEYYGMRNTTFSFDIVNRHISGFQKNMKISYSRRDEQEIAVRITRDFMNERLQLTALYIAFGENAKNGSIARLTTDYEIQDALNLTVGVITYQDGDPPPFDSIDKNDRLFAEIKWSF